jgi:hypothetical protein
MSRTRKGSLITLGTGRRPLRCLACAGELFRHREIKLDTHHLSGVQATGLVCLECGYLHTFVDGVGTFDMWQPDQGYPAAVNGTARPA